MKLSQSHEKASIRKSKCWWHLSQQVRLKWFLEGQQLDCFLFFLFYFIWREGTRLSNVSVVSSPIHTRRIKATAVVRQFSTDGDSHRARQLCLCRWTAVNSHRKPALWLLKRAWRYASWWRRQCFIMVFSWCPSDKLTPSLLGQTLGELKSFAGDRCCFSGRRRVGRMGGRTDTSPHTSVVFFSSYKMPKTVTVTTLLLFGHVTSLCGKFLCIKLIKGPVKITAVRSTRPWYAKPAYPFTLVRFSNNTKFHPSPLWRDSHWDGGGELVY